MVSTEPMNEAQQSAPRQGKDRGSLPVFFLHSLRVRKFRSIEDATFTFQPGLNVIIGANNAAKTAVIDALRLIFSIGTFEKKEDYIRLRHEDVFTNGSVPPPSPRSVTFSAVFYGKEDSAVGAHFYELLCPTEVVPFGPDNEPYVALRLEYVIDFEYDDARGRYIVAGSSLKGGVEFRQPVPQSILDSVRAIYLAPLRDLVNDRPRVGAEIERLIVSHTHDGMEERRQEIPERLRQEALELIKEVTSNDHHAAASERLRTYAKPYKIPEGSLSFVPSGISASLFSTMLPEFTDILHGDGRLPLSSNGLGINQLIYASIVLSRRGRANDHAYRFFLIEEPEAHLHPQLQDSFFHALNQITEHQLFVTSHSPTITAKTDLDKIIVMRRDDESGTAQPLHLADAFRGREDDKRYLHKFLDVTRSQLLFARGAVFVEGVTEAMLMQRFSETIGLSLRDESIEVVLLGSSGGFDHFRPLFDNGSGNYYRAAFVTDGDERADAVPSDDQLKTARAGTYDPAPNISGSTGVFTGFGTFEFGLLCTAIADGGRPGMQEVLRSAMQAAAPAEVSGRPGQGANFARDFMDFDHPSLAYKRMKQKKASNDLKWHGTWHTNTHFKTAKSDFAFRLYEALEDDESTATFVVPPYIGRAIEFVLGMGSRRQDGSDATDD